VPDAPALPAPAPKRGPLRWILLGCGVLTGIFVLGMGSCAGIFYFIYKGSDDTAKIGEAYLRNAPGLSKVIDQHASIERDLLGWNISIVNDAGNARFTYTIKHDDGRPTEAVVWLVRSAGAWKAVGARVRPNAGEPVTVGEVPKEHHRVDWD